MREESHLAKDESVGNGEQRKGAGKQLSFLGDDDIKEEMASLLPFGSGYLILIKKKCTQGCNPKRGSVETKR